MKILLLLTAGLALLGLTACNQPSDVSNLVGDLSAMTVDDLQEALVIAVVADDKPAIQCYAGLIPIVQALPGQVPDLNLLTGKPITDFEKARLLAKKAASFSGSSDPLVQSVNLACGALYMDAKGDVVRLLIKLRP